MNDKTHAAGFLINLHFEVEPHMEVIYRFVGDNEDDLNGPIMLLEVNADSQPTREFNAFGFAPSKDVQFQTLVSEVTPEELETLRREQRLPPHWDVTRGKPYYRRAA